MDLPTDNRPARPCVGESFERLVEIMARLRAPGGCPWDREQTFDTIKPYTLEETYEVLDAIDARDWAGLARRTRRPDPAGRILRADGRRRGPVHHRRFTGRDQREAGPPPSARLRRCRGRRRRTTCCRAGTKIKARREEAEGRAPQGRLLGSSRARCPRWWRRSKSLPKAAARGLRLAQRRSGAREAARRTRRTGRRRATARHRRRKSKASWAICCSCWSTWRASLKVDPEQALRKTNAKFRRRFGYIERKLAASGTEPRGIDAGRDGGAVAAGQDDDRISLQR